MERINDAQRRKVMALCNQLNLDTDLRHQITAALTEGRTESLTELSKAEACRLIDYLVERSGGKPSGPKNRASGEQKWKIRDLANQLGWTEPARLKGFIRKYARVDMVDWLTPLQASNVIEGLKRLLDKEQQKEVKAGGRTSRG